MPTDYVYKDPKTQQVYRYGDPTLNADAIRNQGLEFVSGPNNPNPAAPGAPVVAADPVTRYTAPATTGGPIGAAGAAFGAGGAYDPNVKPYTPEEEQVVRDKARTQAQASIDAINEMANKELAAAQVRGQNRLGQNRAIAAATGTQGSGTDTTRVGNITELNAQEIATINAEKEAKTQAILTGVQDRSDALVKAHKEDARTNADKYVTYLAGVADSARKDMTALAQAGAVLDDNQRNKLMEQTGYDPATFDTLYKSMTIANSNDIINKDKPQIVGNKAVFFKQTKDAKTGQITLKTITLDLPEAGKSKELDSTVARDDGIYAFYKDGTWEKVGAPKAAAPKPGEPGSPGLKTGDMEFGTPEYTLAAIESSAQYGDKRLLADERKNITASKRALGMLETYNKLMDGSLDNGMSKEIFGDGTGIIKGRVRTLASQWGGDANAAAINATIQGIIPTIARGIFQEVGVLTDQDIANYRKTVPDINKPENANKLIELVLLRTLERAYADTLLTAAQNQTNVSNFKPEYESVVKRINKLTGGSSATAKPAEVQSAKDAAIGDVVEIGGKKYKKSGTNAYDPI
ncbi:MAG: hypothetical protein AAB964_00390 [Patescibacteria group bacterium]